jgi:formylglycine-generating enzyme required for sulfatase activity
MQSNPINLSAQQANKQGRKRITIRMVLCFERGKIMKMSQIPVLVLKTEMKGEQAVKNIFGSAVDSVGRLQHSFVQSTIIGVLLAMSPISGLSQFGTLSDKSTSAGTAISAPRTSSDSLRNKDIQKKEMVFVKSGSFKMGNNNGYEGERPEHAVRLNDFYIDRHEVTVGEYRIFCAATARLFPAPPAWGWNDNDPMVKVTWNDAVAFATWVGKRLPTEAEWEYAARGGQQSKGYKYSGSNEIDEAGWFVENSKNKTHPVGTKKGNELGIYDMTGNALEWCTDWYSSSYYNDSPEDNPKGPSKKWDHIIRGGSMKGDRDDCRVTFRNNAAINRQRNDLGFRCVMDK